MRLLNSILGGVLVFWMVAFVGGINNVLQEYRHSGDVVENPQTAAVAIIAIYVAATIIFFLITFNRKWSLRLRAGLLLGVLYALGVLGMLLSSFSGDGRIFFFALIVLAGIFFEVQYSLTAFITVLLTMAVLGYLEVSEIVTVPPEWQVNAGQTGAWVTGGVVLLLLSLAALLSITYLLKAFEQGLSEVERALQREQHLSRVLRMVGGVNQLTTRVKDEKLLLKETCKLIVSEKRYAFCWIGLLEPGGNIVRFSTYAGNPGGSIETHESEPIQSGHLPVCAEAALRQKAFVYLEPGKGGEYCKTCSRWSKHLDRFAISLPLMQNNKILGVFVVDYDSPMERFGDGEIELLQELADNLAYALENIEASRRLSIYASRQKLLNEITQTTLSVRKLDDLLYIFIEKLESALGANAYYFAIWDDTRQLPVKFISSENLREILVNMPVLTSEDNIFSRSILEAGKVLAIPDLLNTPYISSNIAARFGMRSALGIPLITNDQRLGVLVFGYREKHAFKEEDLELAYQMSHQFALAILKVKLDEETHLKAAEQEHLYSLTNDMASNLLDPSSLLAKLARHLTEALNVTSVNITTINLEADTMQVVAEYWSNEAAPAEVHSDLGREYQNSDYKTVLDAMIAKQFVVLQEDDENMTAIERGQFTEYKIKSMLFVPIMAHGKMLGTIEIWESRRRREFTEPEIRLTQAMTSHAAGVIENAKLYELMEQREAHFRALIENSAEGVAIVNAEGILTYVAPSEEFLTGYTPDEMTGISAFEEMHPEDAEKLKTILAENQNEPGKVLIFEYRVKKKNGEWAHFEATGHNLLHDPNVQGVVVNYRDITRRKQVELNFKESQDRLNSIITTAPSGIIVVDSHSRIVLMNPAAENIFACSSPEMVGKELENLIPERFRGMHHHFMTSYGKHGISNRKLGRSNTLYGLRTTGHEFPMEAFISKYEMNGEMFFTVTLQDITERKKDEDNLHRRAEELQTLAFVSSALRTAANVSEIIPLVVRHAVEIVSGDYGTIYLIEESSGNHVSPGWYSVENKRDIRITEQPLLRHKAGHGITGHVAQTGEIYITEDIQKDPVAAILPDEQKTLADAHSGISLPLLSREKVVGVLHIRLKAMHYFTETEVRLLTAIAEMAGSALHRATLYEQTLKLAEELTQAYDSTLSGWARALELRDELTEGHTRRVTELTLELARAMQVSESDIIHIRRGAILHDIGKMGIPDSILNKPGPFTAHEQRIMRMHPQYAYEMLSFIPFLQPALPIPYCHHEWWDGGGYPRGLKGEDIPLAARIFSVVDVWDALTSERPYRPAWTREKTLQYIIDLNGKQFDPQVVEAFLRLIETR